MTKRKEPCRCWRCRMSKRVARLRAQMTPAVSRLVDDIHDCYEAETMDLAMGENKAREERERLVAQLVAANDGLAMSQLAVQAAKDATLLALKERDEARQKLRDLSAAEVVKENEKLVLELQQARSDLAATKREKEAFEEQANWKIGVLAKQVKGFRRALRSVAALADAVVRRV